MKKVIFVGGTSFSGSTFLDMILANDPRGFSCGEVRALFHPWRPHHINPECGCGDVNCRIWQQVLENGEKNLYKTIFSLFDVDFILDSSKDLFWIKKQMRYLSRQNLDVKNVLIWKTPLELACSFKKRDRLKEWKKSWINYHRAYLTLIESHMAVKYSDLTQDEKVLIRLCEYLEIPYFPEKTNYWEKTHHTLFGNTSAKIHLYSRDSEKFEKGREKLMHGSGRSDKIASDHHRSVYYDTVKDQSLIDFVKRELDSDENFRRVADVISLNGKADGFIHRDKIKVSSMTLNAIKLRKWLSNQLFSRFKLLSSRAP